MSVELVGTRIRLRVMTADDAGSLVRAASDGELWNVPFTVVPTAASVEGYVANALAAWEAGTCLPFVIELLPTREVIGTSRFVNVDMPNRQLELSHAWIAASHQGTLINTEHNYLMLKFAFEDLCCIRVQARADELNLKARRPLERAGARQEGVLRNERIMPDGRIRNAVLYSFIDDEWPSVKRGFEQRLELAVA